MTDLIARHGRPALLVLIAALVAALAYGVPGLGGGEGPAQAGDPAPSTSSTASEPEPEPQPEPEREREPQPEPEPEPEPPSQPQPQSQPTEKTNRPPEPRSLPSGVHRRAWLLAPALLRERPGGRPVSRLGMRTQFGSPTVLAVVGEHGPWLGVLSERRPNGRVGWIHERRVHAGFVAFELHASLRRRELTLLHRGRPVRRMRVAIGRSGTPTPRGRFAVTDRLATEGISRAAYGCCAIALSGRQPFLPAEWRGGDRLAIHSTSATSSIGSPASFGCLRASERDMQWLMRRIPLGTPIRIA